jgi:hypothetical protein
MVFLFSACACKSAPTNNDIDQKKAIDAAAEIASMSMPEISGSQVPPTNIVAVKLTLEEAAKRLNSDPQEIFSDVNSNTKIWLVSMNGIWLPVRMVRQRRTILTKNPI